MRIGSVPYLNARPLTEGLEDVVLDVPSRLAGRFREGEFDVALLPSFEVLRRPGRPVVPGISVASPGPVDSVLFFSRQPITSVRRVLLDESSLTSSALARVLLTRFLGMEVEFAACPADTDPRVADADAVLLIGDGALTAPREGLVVTDLAVLWRERTGLPFCFAVWVAADAATAALAEPLLRAAKQAGLARRREIARAAALETGLTAEALHTYLCERITYDLGEGELRALALYGEHCKELGLV